jgi:hypothetical protein
MMAAIYAYAPRDRKTYSLAALACTIALAVLTCATHFASLTVGRQIDSNVSPLLSQQLSFEPWPTVALALDLLARDFFLGLAMLLQHLFSEVRGHQTAFASACLWPARCVWQARSASGLRDMPLCFRLFVFWWR